MVLFPLKGKAVIKRKQARGESLSMRGALVSLAIAVLVLILEHAEVGGEAGG